jgi:hypothetical protein
MTRPELVFVGDDQGVGIVDAHGLDLDHHLARSGRGVHDLLDNERFRAAGGLGQDCAHRNSFQLSPVDRGADTPVTLISLRPDAKRPNGF